MDNAATALTDYLRRLEVAATRLPAERREELVAQIREHLLAVAAETPPEDEAGLRQALDRLGDPEEIVRDALAEDGSVQDARAAGPGRVRTPWFEMVAVTLLLVGGFAFGIGWIVGVVMTWSSARWSVRDKLLGTLIWPGGLVGVLLMQGVTTGGEACSSMEPSPQPSLPGSGAGTPVATPETCETFGFMPPLWVGIAIITVVVLAPFVVAFHLLRTARRVPPVTPSVPTTHTQHA
jgi:hypothetical protein